MESHIPGWEEAEQTAPVLAPGRDDLLARMIRDFEEAEQATQDARELAERDRDYYDGKQLTDDVLAELARRNQPAIVINRIKRKVDYLLGHERATRTDPKAYPRTMKDQGAAEAATDALRYVCDAERFDSKRSNTWENLLVEGYGGCEVGARINARGQVEVSIEHVPWDRLFHDPHSRRGDFSDARYLGIVLWLDREEAEERWPDAADVVSATLETVSTKTYDDRPAWVDSRRKRVRVVQMYYRRKGTWHVCFFVRGGFLEAPRPVDYLDEDGNPTCPLILQSAYVDRENNRYGVVREMIGPQDEVNKRRSKALHLISVRQTVGEIGAVQDVPAMKRELARPDGHVEVAPNMRFELLDTSDMAAAQFNLLTEAKQEIDLIGPNASMMGKDNKAPSGRAILAQQQGGTIELGPLSDALRQWQWRVYRAIWCRIRQFWTEERWVRVADDEKNLKWVGLNRPVTLADQIGQDPAMMAQVEQARQAVAQANPAMLPRFEQDLQAQLAFQVGVENEVALMDIDISLEDAPDVVTLQAEQFELLAQLAGALPPGTIPPDVLIEASTLRGEKKRALIDRMQQAAQAPPPDPLVQEAAAAQVRKTQSEAAKNEAAAQKSLVDAQFAQFQPAPGMMMQ